MLLAENIQGIEETVLRLVPEMLPASWVGLAVADFVQSEMRVIAVYPPGDQATRNWSGALEWNWTEEYKHPGPVHTVRDLTNLIHTSDFYSILWQEGIRSLLTIPLLDEGRIKGFLVLGGHIPYRWSLDDIFLAREIADTLSIGLLRVSELTRLQKKASIQEVFVSRRSEDVKIAYALLQAVFDSVNSGIIILNRHGAIIDANQVLQNMWGYTIDELRGKAIQEFIDQPQGQKLTADEVMARTDPVEVPVRHKNGHSVACRVILSSQFDQDESGLILLTIDDLDEQQRNRFAIQQAERLSLTGRLAASLIHEINNPLQSAIGCLGLTEEVINEGGDISKYLHVASEELERAARIVSQLRDLNQPSLYDNQRVMPIVDLIEHTLMLVSKQCKDNHIRVTFHDEIGRNQVLLPERVQQVFLNLALNAVDAMQKGGELTIYLTINQSLDEISVSFIDTGMGISSETLAHIFDPFFSTKTGGLGLGLYISETIIQDIGGKIEVKSYPGKGTTFTVIYPIKALGQESNKQVRNEP
jgi:PAS domain S-box-containing protein